MGTSPRVFVTNIFTLCLLFGCAANPNDVAPMALPQDTFRSYSCNELERELLRLRKDESDLTIAMAGALGAQAGSVFGAVAILPAYAGIAVLATSANTDSSSKGRLSRIKGEIQAIESNRAARCSTPKGTSTNGGLLMGMSLDSLRLGGKLICISAGDPDKQACDFNDGGTDVKLAVLRGSVRGIQRNSQGGVQWEWSKGCSGRAFSFFDCQPE